MKLRVEKESDPDGQPDWPADAVFDYDRFGNKIMVWPRSEIWVKDCVTGEPIEKKRSTLFRRDKENFYYLKKGAVPPTDDFSDNLIPSRWDEAK